MKSSYKYLQVSTEDSVAEIVMERPPVNVLNIEMMRELSDAIEAQAKVDELKLLVLKARGKVFCAGVDVGDHTPDNIEAMMAAFNGVFKRLETFPALTLAVVDGAALGGGCELAVGFDMVYASARTKFGQPEIKLGFFPPFAAWVFPRLVGRNRALELCLTGESIDAAYAAEIGLINRVFDDEDLGEEVERFKGIIRSNSAHTLRMAKQAIDENIGRSLAEAIPRLDDLVFNGLMKSEDTIEGLASFLEKRKPVWKNR